MNDHIHIGWPAHHQRWPMTCPCCQQEAEGFQITLMEPVCVANHLAPPEGWDGKSHYAYAIPGVLCRVCNELYIRSMQELSVSGRPHTLEIQIQIVLRQNVFTEWYKARWLEPEEFDAACRGDVAVPA